MKRTFFDKIIVGILILLVVAFLGLATYMSYSTQKVLVSEKQDTLINEAMLLSKQTIGNYLEGLISLEQLQVRLDEFEDTLKTNIWLYGGDGALIAASNRTPESVIPQDISKLDTEIKLSDGFTQTGDFYGLFDKRMISIGIPIFSGENLEGFMVLHTSMTELKEVQDEMISIMYVPFFTMLLVVVLVLVYFSGTVLRPLSKINHAAREYAKGNFEARANVKRNDELGELSDSLEYMAKELSKLDEYRKNFIANISHDFRSPLTSIKGYLEAMLDGTIPVEKYDRYLNIVLNEAQRLTKLTAGLLELNSFDTHGPVLKRQKFDIVDVVRETQNTFEGRCEKKRIQLRLTCSVKDATVYADKMKIGQVIYNLIDNAIKFSPEYGKIDVTISKKNDKIFVSVKDEGPGIENDKQNKVWDRFYKTDSSRGKDKQGTGLGLSITKEIIKAHGEHINLISTKGAGSEFIFSLPREPVEKKDNVIG
ncbi:MAG: HAMP domain-containing sensor histidine kinase [Clostridiales bacterium]|nr:HAMP domain-containing sensor histidine kinase [Clostridiales bacterium]